MRRHLECISYEIVRAVALEAERSGSRGLIRDVPLLYKRPELVHAELFERVKGQYINSPFVRVEMYAGGDSVFWTTTWRDQLAVTPKGHHGDPTAASARKGEELFEAVVANGVQFIDEMRRFDGARTGIE
jgi:creatinine amidohydrolase/Fe(II)-dependent formamide hydrolase-like protein